jgi:uncharacterized protein YjbI with pentapeptide repeats
MVAALIHQTTFTRCNLTDADLRGSEVDLARLVNCEVSGLKLPEVDGGEGGSPDASE